MDQHSIDQLTLSRSYADKMVLSQLGLELRHTVDYLPPDTFDGSFETEQFRGRPWWEVEDILLSTYRFSMCVLTDRQKAYYFIGVLAGAVALLTRPSTKKNREKARLFSGIMEDLFDEDTGWQHPFWKTLQSHELALVGRVFLAIIPFVSSWELCPELWARLACEGSKWVITGEFADESDGGQRG